MVRTLSQSRGILAILVAVTLILVTLALAYSQEFEVPTFVRPSSGSSVEKGTSHLSKDDLRKFYIEKVTPPSASFDTKVYRPHGAFEWKLPDKLKWDKSFGKDLCILDLDSRPLDKPGEIFGPTVFSWDKPDDINGPSLGTLEHWLYAKIHGYTYYWVQTGEYEDRRGSWKKPSILKRVLQKHPVCVFVDSDALFNHMDLPFEWLMNYWGIEPGKDLLSLAADPKGPKNLDEKGRVYDNTGFMVGQAHQTLYDMMDEWDVCADDGGKYPNCTLYRTKDGGHPSDQGGFGNYIRYEYEDSVRELPCSEANGFPEHVSSCKGTFIKHLWTGKRDLIKIAVGEQIPGKFLELFHEQMLAEKKEFFLTEEELMSDSWLPKTPQVDPET